jgi:hypothetical protein
MKFIKSATKYFLGFAIAANILLGVIMVPSAYAMRYEEQGVASKLHKSTALVKPILNLDQMEEMAILLMEKDDPDSAELYRQYLVEFDNITAPLTQSDDPNAVEEGNKKLDLLFDGKYKDVIDLYNSYYSQLLEE